MRYIKSKENFKKCIKTLPILKRLYKVLHYTLHKLGLVREVLLKKWKWKSEDLVTSLKKNIHWTKMTFSINDFFSKCHQIHSDQQEF